MPRISYHSTNFPPIAGPALMGSNVLEASWAEIVWAAVSVGKQGLMEMVLHGSHSVDEIRFRVFLVKANLMESGNTFCRSPVYDSLDPSEKGAISYFLGLTVAKLFASKLLAADWMVHLDRVIDMYAIGLKGRSRPDLVGRDTLGRWIVMEGKGRTGRHSDDALAKAKSQVEEVGSIQGTAPYLRVATVASFDESLVVYLDDPSQAAENSVPIDINPQVVQRAYYKPFLPIRRERTRTIVHRGTRYDVVDFKTLGATVGICEDAEDRQAAGNRASVEPDQIDDSSAAEWEYGTFGDGLIVGLDESWSQKNMELPPDRRESAF